MMRLRFSSILGFILLVFASDATAAIGFQLYDSLTIPYFGGTPTLVQFRDLDGDGSPEILAAVGADATLYSPARDSVYFSITSLLNPPPAVESILLEDVDRDSIPDAVIGYRYLGSEFEVLKLKGPIFTGIGAWRSRSLYVSPFGGCGSGPDVTMTVVNTADGYNRLLVSSEHISAYIAGWAYEDTDGKSTLYYSFPDSVLAEWPLYFTQSANLPRPSGKSDLWLRQSECHFVEGNGNPLLSYQTSNYLLTRDSILTSVVMPSTQFCNLEVQAAHVDITDSSMVDVIATGTVDSQCGVDSGQTPGNFLYYFRLDSAGHVANSWTADIGSTTYDAFQFLPDLPGFFLAFQQTSCTIFNERTGLVKTEVTGVPTGHRFWDNHWPDKKPRLVTANGPIVRVYTVDVATDIADQDRPNSVPSKFELEDPYPNPFNLATTLSIRTGSGGNLSLEIINIEGRRVALLFDGYAQPNKDLRFVWDATGRASGVYFARLQLAGEKQVKKMLLLK